VPTPRRSQQGRGSAANSAVCSVLGVTELDPARMDLLLQRFISKERLEPPDNRHDEPPARCEQRRFQLRKIVDALGKIREALPPGSSLNVLSVAPQGNEVVAREGSRLWESTTGQYALPLTIDTKTPSVTTLKRCEVADRRRREAARQFEHALALEDSDVDAARAGYLAALDARSGHLEARINLGRLLHLNGELKLGKARSSSRNR
jgi:hypothetical protein